VYNLSTISNKIRKIANDVTNLKGVSSQEEEDKVEEQDSLSILKSCADDFVLLMRTIDDNDNLKQNIKSLYSLIHKFNSKIIDVHNGLNKVLNTDKKAEGNELSEFTESLRIVTKELSPYLELTLMMKDLANRVSANIEKEKKHKPIEHKLPKKEKVEIKEEKSP